MFRKVKEEENSPESIHHEILLESVELTFAKIFIDGDVGSKDSIIRIIKEHDQDNEIEGTCVCTINRLALTHSPFREDAVGVRDNS